MAQSSSKPDDKTLEAQRREAARSHTADRAGTHDEEVAARERESSLTDQQRRRVREHEREMGERGVHQRGEGRIE